MAVGGAWTCLVGPASWPGIASTCVGLYNSTHPEIVLTKTQIWTKNLIVERIALCLFVPFDFKFPFWAGGEEEYVKFFSLGKIEGVDEHFFYAPVSVKIF